MKTDPVTSFFARNDAFLRIQFDHARGVIDSDTLLKTHSEFVSYVHKLRFQDESLDHARLKWSRLLEGASVNLGFPQFRDLPVKPEILTSYLNKFRSGVQKFEFNKLLAEYKDAAPDPKGLDLEIAPREWLSRNDVAITVPVDPVDFKNRIFKISGHDPKNAEYKFIQTRHGGFFMMALNLMPVYFIGYGPLDSLFSLSTLAHEIGHTTTPRSESLCDVFLNYPDNQKTTSLTNEENESYEYERIFMEHVTELVAGLDPSVDYREVLAKRKAIQYNLHVLANQLNELFFAGESLQNIAEVFKNQIAIINPGFHIQNEFEWIQYASLDQPLSKVGFLRAYQSHFLRS